METTLFYALGFGGPAAHIAMMEDEVVNRRKWIDREHFLDLIGATNLIPGPNSTEMTMHVGFTRAGWPGLITAGGCFILPAATVLIILQLPWLGLTGILPSMLWYLIPTTAPTLLLMAAFEPIEPWQMAYGFGYSLAVIALLFWWARRAFYTNLILRGG